MIGFSTSSGSCELTMSSLSRTSLVRTSISLPNSNSNVINDIFSEEREVICFRLLTAFNVFSSGRVTLFSISEALAPGYAVITMIVFVSMSGYKSIGNLDKEKRPKITTARKQREVIIGFLTAPSYKLMLFYLKASPHSSPKKRKPEDRFEIRLINKSIGRKVLYISHLEESWEEASTSTSIPFTKRDCPATTTCELSGTPDFNSYSVPMRLPSSTLL